MDQYRPGEAVAYLSALERGEADAAARSCWFRIRAHKSNCFNGSLNGLLGPDGEGNLAPWWVYRAYAAAVKHRVASKSTNPKLAILAGVIDGPLKEEVQLLIGHTRLVGSDKQRLAPVLINMLISTQHFRSGHGRQYGCGLDSAAVWGRVIVEAHWAFFVWFCRLTAWPM
ncbi:MAG: hypothetical protein GXP23_09595 [Gammaproteobacteria bacterium]|nr:hypothetical protein [Gammaproteobacteria bacterium]